jgi:Spermidine/putrescine-binding periplasmic protein
LLPAPGHIRPMALKGEGQPVATVFPKEGVTGWSDTTMLHSEAKHPVCAYKWMNWSLTPKSTGRCRRLVWIAASRAAGL